MELNNKKPEELIEEIKKGIEDTKKIIELLEKLNNIITNDPDIVEVL